MVPDGASARRRIRSSSAARPWRYGCHDVNGQHALTLRGTRTRTRGRATSSEKRPRLNPISPSRLSASHSRPRSPRAARPTRARRATGAFVAAHHRGPWRSTLWTIDRSADRCPPARLKRAEVHDRFLGRLEPERPRPRWTGSRLLGGLVRRTASSRSAVQCATHSRARRLEVGLRAERIAGGERDRPRTA